MLFGKEIPSFTWMLGHDDSLPWQFTEQAGVQILTGLHYHSQDKKCESAPLVGRVNHKTKTVFVRPGNRSETTGRRPHSPEMTRVLREFSRRQPWGNYDCFVFFSGQHPRRLY